MALLNVHFAWFCMLWRRCLRGLKRRCAPADMLSAKLGTSHSQIWGTHVTAQVGRLNQPCALSALPVLVSPLSTVWFQRVAFPCIMHMRRWLAGGFAMPAAHAVQFQCNSLKAAGTRSLHICGVCIDGRTARRGSG